MWLKTATLNLTEYKIEVEIFPPIMIIHEGEDVLLFVHFVYFHCDHFRGL